MNQPPRNDLTQTQISSAPSSFIPSEISSMNRRQLLPFLTAPLLLPLAGCAKTYSWRQKLTVVVETPSGEKSASSVTSVKWTENFFSHGWGGASYHLNLQGEAIPIDLGGGRYIFVLLRRGGDYEYMGNLLHVLLEDKFPDKYRSRWSKIDEFKKNEYLNISLHQLPFIVEFQDISDPNSVRLVDPSNMADSIGRGFMFKKAFLERVDIPSVHRIDEILTWLSKYKDKGMIDGHPMQVSANLANMLSYNDFKRDE